ncbi:hypothetical protein B7R25_08675 [Subtercola boreus]|uniref:Phosphatidylglycerol lysyltransferase C-terminal domain-containing protein n=2 Tax=Subtercola boreus TaxID=120213 RepID=A0A3E0WA61_9MICO|nr:hypothetical protein B7R24_08610 [Subtercola boreus]RFA20931.1 hypothetical protein B7R23_08550 [Subtercola boreus]RFA27124.1 hypothetical protein B7R25_08675 [Subtercola boreus]
MTGGARALGAVGRWAASIPFTWVIAGVAILVGILQLLFHASIGRLFENVLSMSFNQVVDQHHWFAALTSVLFAPRALHIVILVPIILIVLGAAERLLGTWRTVIAYLTVAIVGGTLGLAVQGLGIWFGIIAAEQIRSHSTIDPLIPVIGTLMAASAFAGPLLRRRIRILGFAALLMFVLYSGMPSDLYRGLAAVAGVFLGMLLHRLKFGRPRSRLSRSSHRELRSLIASLVVITAIGPLITIISPNGFGPLQPLGLLFRDTLSNQADIAAACVSGQYSDLCSDAVASSRLDGVGPVLVTLLPLVVLLVAALGIVRGRRVALWLAVAVNLFFALLGLVYYGVFPAIGANTFFDLSNGQFDQYSISVVISIVLPLVIAVLLVASLPIFPSGFSTGTTARFFLLVAVALLSVSAAYVAAAWALRAQFSPAVTLSDLLVDLPERFMPVGFLSLERSDVFPTGDAARVLYEWVGPVFWVIVIVASLLSITRLKVGSEANASARIRSLLHTGVTGSLSWMATWTGHHYWFQGPEQGAAAVAYRVINGIAIATGEPLCAPDDRGRAIAEFSRYCTDHGWTPVFYAVSGDLAAEFTALDFSLMQVAEEAVVELPRFSLEGKKMQGIRTAINKAVKLGITAEWTSFARLSTSQVAQVRDISEQWVAEKDLPEMGFTLGGLDELIDPDVRLMLAVDADDQVLGVTSWLPSYRDGEVVGWTLDFMRRRSDSVNGVMEFTIAETILRARAAGLSFVSLSAAPLAQGGTEDSAKQEGATQALLGVLGRALEPVYGFQSLLSFKQKFKPTRVPLYLAYADPLTLPLVGVSLARAYVPTFSARHALGFLGRSS